MSNVFGNCENCRAATPYKDSNDLRATKFKCEKHPPTPAALLMPQGNGRVAVVTMTCWAITEKGHGCWEFKPRTGWLRGWLLRIRIVHSGNGG